MLHSHINDHDNDRDKLHVSCKMHVPDASNNYNFISLATIY